MEVEFHQLMFLPEHPSLPLFQPNFKNPWGHLLRTGIQCIQSGPQNYLCLKFTCLLKNWKRSTNRQYFHRKIFLSSIFWPLNISPPGNSQRTPPVVPLSPSFNGRHLPRIGVVANLLRIVPLPASTRAQYLPSQRPRLRYNFLFLISANRNNFGHFFFFLSLDFHVAEPEGWPHWHQLIDMSCG